MSTTEYKASPQNRMVRSTAFVGSPAVQYVPKLVKVHAVAIDEGEASELTVCGDCQAEDLAGAMPFEQIAYSIRCPKCADILGLPYV
jgi:hypothetical protein